MKARLVRGRHAVLMVAAVAVAAILLLAVVVARKGWEQAVTALPHWPVSCPGGVPAMLVIGQSQASNTGEGRRVPTGTGYAFADGRCYALRDPMPGTAGRSGSIWPGFVDALGRPVVVANLAISGSAIGEWTTPAALARVRATLAGLRAAGYAEPLVVWMQGETDGALRTRADAYFRQLETLMTVAPDARWLLTRESICADVQTKWRPLDDARDRLSATRPNVVIGPDLDRIPLALRQSDRCHMTMAGQDRLARELADAVGPLLPAATR